MPSFVMLHSGQKIDELAGGSPQKLEVCDCQNTLSRLNYSQRMVKMAAQLSSESSSESGSDKEDGQ